MYEFRWNEWSREKVAMHGVTPAEAEHVVEHARPPYPELVGDEKRLVVGQTAFGDYVQVIYILDDDDTVFVIHGRPLTDQEKRRFRRRQR